MYDNDASDIKQRLGNRAKDIIVNGTGVKLNKNDAGLCLFHKEKTPSMVWNKKAYNFKCFGCHETLDIFSYYTKFENMSFIEAKNKVLEMLGEQVTTQNVRKKKETPKPDLRSTDLTIEMYDVMALRGIEKETLDFWKVKAQEINGEMWFKYLYKDEKGDFPYSNRRLAQEPCPSNKKAMPCGKDLKQILWGMWHIDTTKPLIITEGQPDAMAIWQAGYKNVVSVPAGASNLNWIESCYYWLKEIEEIYIYGDNDDPGIKMIQNIKDRLGADKVRTIEHNRKDANEVLLNDGPKQIMKDIEDAMSKTPEGLTNIGELQYEYEEDGEVEGIPTGFKGLDYEIEYLKQEEVSVIFGRTGEGKSTIVSQIICNSIQAKRPVFLYSGEMGDKKVKRWLYKQASGMSKEHTYKVEKNIGGLKKVKYEIKPDIVKAIDRWAENNFITLDKKSVSVRKELESLFKVMKVAIQRYGCKLLIIDNLMSAIQETTDHYFNQSNFMAMCVEFAVKNSCHVMVVAHPNKTTDEGDKLKKTNVSGSGNIVNMADLVIGVEKFTDEQIEKMPDNMKLNGCLRLLKNREEGTGKELAYRFNKKNKRLTEYLEIEGQYTGFDVEPNYDWDRYLSDKQKYNYADQTAIDDNPFEDGDILEAIPDLF